MVGQEAKSGHSLQLHWIPRQFRQSGPFFRHSGSRQQLLIYLEARFSPDLVLSLLAAGPVFLFVCGTWGVRDERHTAGEGKAYKQDTVTLINRFNFQNLKIKTWILVTEISLFPTITIFKLFRQLKLHSRYL